jgi:hypothetical protein
MPFFQAENGSGRSKTPDCGPALIPAECFESAYDLNNLHMDIVGGLTQFPSTLQLAVA